MQRTLIVVTRNISQTIKRNIVHKATEYDIEFMHFLRNLPSPCVTELSNGLRVATEERIQSPSVAVGLFIDGGCRYESQAESGITHFIEHLAFKGQDGPISSLGAEFKCHVGREVVSLTTECISNHVQETVEILANAAFKNPFSSEEITREQKTVLLEMKENETNYKNVVMDYLHLTAFQGTSLQQSVLGRSANVAGFSQTAIKNYLGRFWTPRRTVLAVVGGACHNAVVEIANKIFGDVKQSKELDKEISLPYRFTGSEIRYRNDDVPAANIAIAVEGPCFCDSDNLIMNLAAAYLGGYHKYHGKYLGVNPLALAGADLAEGYKAFNISYKDVGLWGIHFLAEPLQQEDMLYNIQNQWMRLCTSITNGELERVKFEMKSKMIYKTESNMGALYDTGRWILLHGTRPLITDVMNEIDHIKAEDVRSVCHKYIYNQSPAVAAVGPVEGLPEYNRIHGGMYWLRT